MQNSYSNFGILSYDSNAELLLFLESAGSAKQKFRSNSFSARYGPGKANVRTSFWGKCDLYIYIYIYIYIYLVS